MLDLTWSEELVVDLQTGDFPREALIITAVLVFPAANSKGRSNSKGVESQPLLGIETKELVLLWGVGLTLVSVYSIDHEGAEVIEDIKSEANVSPLIRPDWSVFRGLECEAVTRGDRSYSQGRSVTEKSHQLDAG